MIRLLLILPVIVFTSCSFDNKTGIWNDISNIPVDNQTTESITNNKPGQRYEEIFTKNKIFDEEIESINSSNIVNTKPVKMINWFEEYATPSNNISNFFYSDNKILLSKSSRLNKNPFRGGYTSNKKIVFYKDNLIYHDYKGTIFIYSLKLNKKIFKYNFYKKNFKNIKKKINFIINDNVLFAADNLGYFYALNLNNNTIIWAKNYGIPFRSNIKFANKQIFLANQDNVIYSIDPNTGDKNWQFSTSLTFLKSNFENNLSLDEINNNLFFLNTSGELYSINYANKKINWVLNFKNSTSSKDTELFLSHPLIVKNNNLIITTDSKILSYNSNTAMKNWSFSAEPIFKPIITLNNTYALLKNNLLICLDNKDGTVIWSKNIFKIDKNKKIKKKFNPIIDFKIVNGEINVYSNNGHLLSFNSKSGDLNYQSRISKNGITSAIVFLNENMLFIDKSNKLLKFN
jgi:outer membrane protein assembly factor BamB